jgi:hypothetical protein
MRANSQFPQLDFHQLDTRPYGLRTDNHRLIHVDLHVDGFTVCGKSGLEERF